MRKMKASSLAELVRMESGLRAGIAAGQDTNIAAEVDPVGQPADISVNAMVANSARR